MSNILREVAKESRQKFDPAKITGKKVRKNLVMSKKICIFVSSLFI